MDKIRVRYSKTGSARYISHLDLMTTMKRAFIRAGVSLKYSEGFNPHPYLSVALPLSVGAESVCELLDVALVGGSAKERINDYMPEGLKIQKAYRAWRGFSEIKWIEVECRLVYNENVTDELTEILTEGFAAESLVIMKRTKRGTSAFDVGPHICDVRVSRADNMCFDVRARISAQNPTITQKDIISAVAINERAPTPIYAEMKRVEIYDKDMLLFK